MAFYDTFERLCKERGITPTQAARDNGLKQQSVSSWKTRSSTPKAQTIQKLADYFGVPIAYLLGEEQIFPVSDETKACIDDQIQRNRHITETNLNKLNLFIKFRYHTFTDPDFMSVRWLIDSFSRLNKDGQKKVEDYAWDLTHVPQYQQEGPQEAIGSTPEEDIAPPSDASTETTESK